MKPCFHGSIVEQVFSPLTGWFEIRPTPLSRVLSMRKFRSCSAFRLVGKGDYKRSEVEVRANA